MTILLALFASLFIGASDFLGGIVSRTRSPLETSLVLFLATLVTLVPIAILLGASDLALGVADSALTTALQRGPLTVASVLGNLYPLVTIALGVTLLGERVRIWHAAGIVLAVAGVAMIAGGQ